MRHLDSTALKLAEELTSRSLLSALIDTGRPGELHLHPRNHPKNACPSAFFATTAVYAI